MQFGFRWLSFIFGSVYILAQSGQDNALCGLIASTRIESLFSQWSCNITGFTTSDPCNPVWSRLSCNGGSKVTALVLYYIKTTSLGSLPYSLGSLTSLEFINLCNMPLWHHSFEFGVANLANLS